LLGLEDKMDDSFASRHAKAPAPMAYSITTAVQATGGAVSRTRMFELIKNGELDARKVGRRTVIMAESLRALLDRLPRVGAPDAA
jgi:hypothetical protein